MTSLVDVTGGQIQGIPSPHDAAITLYLGVPYAAPPTESNRFKPPQPVIPWSGVRLCDHIGPVCPQMPPDPRYLNILDGFPQSEDCLYLNVFVPDGTREDKPWPVFMWIHGGAFREGGSADPNFDGTGLAKKGVIVVVPTFRLGVFGFLAHPELSAESPSGTSGNMGIQDNLQALRWIQDNIAKFVGDPTRVTVGGQSAGSAKTQIILFSPLSKGLIHRAIIQSGARSPQEPATSNSAASYRLLRQAEEDGVDLFKELGIKDLAELRQYPDIRKLAQLSQRRDTRVWGPPPFFRSTLDGYVFPKTYSEVMARGPPNDVPVIVGQNEDEGGTYNEPRFTIDDLRECIEGRFGPDAVYGKGSDDWVQRFWKTYPVADEEVGKGPLQCWNKSARDNTRLNLSLWAQAYHRHTKSPVYGYYFTHHIPNWPGFVHDWDKPKVAGFTNSKGPLYGAYHSAEFAYTFNSLITNSVRPWAEEDRVLGEKISTLWANFMKYGDPNGREGVEDRPEGVQQWPTLQERPDVLLQLGGDFSLVRVAEPAAITFWKEYISVQKAW